MENTMLDKKIPFDAKLAGDILKTIDIQSSGKDIEENDFYNAIISKVIKEDEAFLDIKRFKFGFDILEKVMQINARNFMIIEMIHRMGYHQFSKVVDEPDEEHIILNYLYELGKHENRYNSLDKALKAIWSAKWDRYKEDKHELIIEELNEKDKGKREFTEKLLECISYNSSSEALDVISCICGDIQKINIPREVERLGGLISNRDLTKSEITNIESHKRKLLIALSKTFRDVINSYIENSEYDKNVWVKNSEALASLYKTFYGIKEEICKSGYDADANRIDGYLSDALHSIIKILYKILPDIDDFDKSHIVLVVLDYLNKTRHRQLKNEYLENINAIKDKKDLFFIQRLLDQFIENDDDQVVAHEAFNIYVATICLPENKEKIRNDLSTRGKVIETLKRFPNNEKDMKEKHRRFIKILSCLNELKNCLPPEIILDYIKQLVNICKKDKSAIDIKTLSDSFSVLESVAINNTNIKNDDLLNENLKGIMESFLQINLLDERLFYQTINRYYKIYGNEGIEKLLRI